VWKQSYNLVKTLRSTKTGRSSANDEDVDIPVIFMSAKSDFGILHESRELGGMYMSAGAILETILTCGVINSQDFLLSLVGSKWVV
jgi:hypothetical protein